MVSVGLNELIITQQTRRSNNVIMTSKQHCAWSFWCHNDNIASCVHWVDIHMKIGQIITVLIIHGFALWRVLHWAHFTGQKIGQIFFRVLLVISVFDTNPLSEPVLAYSLLEPQGQISIRIEKKKIIHTLKWICNCHDCFQHIMKMLINITQGKGWAIIGSLFFWYMHHKLHILTSSYICILLAKLLFSIALVAFQFMASLCCESRSPCTWAGGY